MKLIIHFLVAILLPQISFANTAIQPVILTEQGAKNLGIETTVIEETDLEITTFALGRTEAIPENRSFLSSRIPGRIIETHLKIGDYVEKGQKLILLESRQPGSPPPSLWLTAPASGTITSLHSSLGSPVDPSEPLAEITDLSSMYLIAMLPQASAGNLPQEAKVNIVFPILKGQQFTGNLLKYSDRPQSLPLNMLKNKGDSKTPNLSSTGIIFTIENPEKLLLPGMNAECQIVIEKRNAIISVPREAIQGSPTNRHVYVKHQTIPNAFDRVNIQTGMSSNNHIEILDGLILGDEVVTRGSYSLGFAGNNSGVSLKEAMDAAHGHEHNEDGSELSPEQKKAAAEKADPSDSHEHHGTSKRELLFMISTAILAIVLLFVLLLRTKHLSDDNTELS